MRNNTEEMEGIACPRPSIARAPRTHRQQSEGGSCGKKKEMLHAKPNKGDTSIGKGVSYHQHQIGVQGEKDCMTRKTAGLSRNPCERR